MIHRETYPQQIRNLRRQIIRAWRAYERAKADAADPQYPYHYEARLMKARHGADMLRLAQHYADLIKFHRWCEAQTVASKIAHEQAVLRQWAECGLPIKPSRLDFPAISWRDGAMRDSFYHVDPCEALMMSFEYTCRAIAEGWSPMLVKTCEMTLASDALLYARAQWAQIVEQDSQRGRDEQDHLHDMRAVGYPF